MTNNAALNQSLADVKGRITVVAGNISGLAGGANPNTGAQIGGRLNQLAAACEALKNSPDPPDAVELLRIRNSVHTELAFVRLLNDHGDKTTALIEMGTIRGLLEAQERSNQLQAWANSKLGADSKERLEKRNLLGKQIGIPAGLALLGGFLGLAFGGGSIFPFLIGMAVGGLIGSVYNLVMSYYKDSQVKGSHKESGSIIEKMGGYGGLVVEFLVGTLCIYAVAAGPDALLKTGQGLVNHMTAGSAIAVTALLLTVAFLAFAAFMDKRQDDSAAGLNPGNPPPGVNAYV
jgi:hypothetical protein